MITGSQSRSAVPYPPFAVPGEKVTRVHEESPSLPSIDEFLDDLPSILDFTMVDGVSDEVPVAEPEALAAFTPAPMEDGWASESWQSFDWQSASALAERHSERDAASADWAGTSWDAEDDSESPGQFVSPGPEQPSRKSAADEVASALDGIARRIRSGELVIEDLEGRPPEAAMAAALAILLRMRG
jgi:hypothetical protein